MTRDDKFDETAPLHIVIKYCKEENEIRKHEKKRKGPIAHSLAKM
jgi:hypothetical protein